MKRLKRTIPILGLGLLMIGQECCPPPQVYFRDADGDGFGDEANTVTACECPEGYVDNSDDCDDTYALSNPIATEICDGRDNDCDGVVDELPCEWGSAIWNHSTWE